ncbi:hypothetical protein SOCE26_049000 [Sorangium cellulosum]|uniref:Secreted protein n=1 Tax=Sorangium cellulosum TaxID=56 RepID=A0A2L0EW02_SORCE|nr:hypothetical protein [Sorangium cellulosum]AUX43452.1 hypothetical protein SOCE26_049000 [Sorangium cellulosum]
MTHLRNLTSFALGSVVLLAAGAVRAQVSLGDIRVTDNSPASGSGLPTHYDTFLLRVYAAAADGIYLVDAEIGGVTTALAPADSGYFEGNFDISGLAHGPHLLTIRAYSLLGDVATVERTVHKHSPPLLRMTSPRPHSVISGRPDIYMECAAIAPYSCERACATVYGEGQYVGEGCRTRPADAPSGTLYLKISLNRAVQPGEVLTALLDGRLNMGAEYRQRVGPLYAESSPKLTAVATAPGLILDVDATRILFHDRFQRIGVADRATQQITWASTLPPDPTGTATYGALTPSGAVIQSGTGRIFAWHDGTWRRIAADARLDAVNGDLVVWTRNSEDNGYVHRLSTGINTSIWNRPGSTSPFQADISASGDVYYGSYEEPWIRRLGVGRIGNHAGNLQRPITDGTNVVGRWWNGNVSSSYLYTADGAEVFLGDSNTATSAGLLLHAGYAGFLRGDGAVNQVWVRTPDGEQHQLSAFTTSSLFDQQKLRIGHDGLSDSGEVLFLNGRTRYIGRPGAEPEAISSDLGHGRWLDGSFHVTLGDTLFRVTSTAGGSRLAAPGEALRVDAVVDPGGREELAAGLAADEALEEAPVALWRRQEPDAMPVLSGEEPASDVAGDVSGDGAPAALGCSAGGAAPSGSGLAALAGAIAGLALARRGRRRG